MSTTVNPFPSAPTDVHYWFCSVTVLGAGPCTCREDVALDLLIRRRDQKRKAQRTARHEVMRAYGLKEQT